MELEDIGPKVAESIFEFFQNKNNLALIDELNDLGVNTHALKTKTSVSQKLSGKTFLFTGTLSRMTREEAEKMVEEHGGKLLSSVSKNLNYLVVGASPGSKVGKAEKLKTVEIVGEDEFLKLTSND